MITIRQSFLEQFRRVMETDYASENELIDHIRGKESPNWHMQAGTYFHHLLAADCPTVERYGRDHPMEAEAPVQFSGEDILTCRKHVGPGLVELPGSRILNVGGTQIRLTGIADRVRGLTIRDAKTKFSVPDARDYEQSLQWRIYLLIHECRVFVYDLFHFSEPDKANWCSLKAIVSVRFWPYRGMEAEVREWVWRFLDWASDRNLLRYLEFQDGRWAA